MSSTQIANVEVDIGGLLLKHCEIKDWSVEVSKQTVQVEPFVVPKMIIELSPPYYAYVTNLPFVSTRSEIYYFFGGSQHVKGVYMYYENNGNGGLRGDCMLWLKDVASLVHVLKMHKYELRQRNLNIVYVEPVTALRRDFLPFELDKIRQKIPPEFVPRSYTTFASVRPAGNKRTSGVQKRQSPDNTGFKKFTFRDKPKSTFTPTPQPPPPNEHHVLLLRNAKTVTIEGSLSHKSVVSSKRPLARNSVVKRKKNLDMFSFPTNDNNNSAHLGNFANFNANTEQSSTGGGGGSERQSAFEKTAPAVDSRRATIVNGRPFSAGAGKVFKNSNIMSKNRRQQRQGGNRSAAANIPPGDGAVKAVKSVGGATQPMPAESAPPKPKIVVAPVKNAEVFCQAKPTNANEKRTNEFFDRFYGSNSTSVSKNESKSGSSLEVVVKKPNNNCEIVATASLKKSDEN